MEKSELEAVILAYEAVRGPMQREVMPAGTYARVARLCPITGINAANTELDFGSGLLSVGAPHTIDGSPLTVTTPASVMDGQFALIGYDYNLDELRVLNDPFGMLALYVADRDGRVFVSTSSLALARLLSAPADPLSVQKFLVSGYHFGSATHWQDVERLEPATCMRFTSVGRRDSVYWRPVTNTRVQKLSLEKAVEQCIDTSVEALRFGLAGADRICSDLTGGYDSRLLNLLLAHAGFNVRVDTRDAPDPLDVETAKRIAEIAGWSWTHVELPGDWPERLPNALGHALAWGDGNLEVLQLARVLWAHQELARSASTLISGGGGEHFGFYSWQTEFLRAGRSSRVNWDNWLSMIMIKPADRSVLAGDPVAAVRDDFRRRMRRWAEPYADELNTTQLDVVYALKNTGHFGAYRSASDGVLMTRLPYYYRSVFETAFSTHYKHRNQHRLMRHMMQRLDSRVAGLQSTKGAPAQPLSLTNAHRFVPYYTKLLRKAISKTSDKAFGSPLLLQRGSFNWQPEAHENVLGMLHERDVLPVERMRSARLYDLPRLGSMLSAATKPGFADHAMLGRIVTVELALKAADVDLLET